MKDVVREAGVALGIVSKVFNDIPVGDSYRIKVEGAARRLGYRVNGYARGLKTNKTRTVALTLPNVTECSVVLYIVLTTPPLWAGIPKFEYILWLLCWLDNSSYICYSGK